MKILSKSSNLNINAGFIASFLAIKSSPIAKLTVGLNGENNSCALCSIVSALAARITSFKLISAIFSI